MSNQNTLMFQVAVDSAVKGLEDAQKALEKWTGSIQEKMHLKVSVDQLESLIRALDTLGSGKQLQPLLNKLEVLQTSMVRLGLVPKDVDYSSLESQLKKVSQAYENLTQARKKAGLKEGDADKGAAVAYRQAWNTELTRLEKDFGMSEKVARAALDTFKNGGQTVADALSKVGNNTAGIEKLESKVDETRGKIEGLAQEFGKLAEKLSQMNVSVNLGGDFSKWTEQVQVLVKSVGELVGQMQKLQEQKPSSGVAELNTAINGLLHGVGTLKETLTQVSGAFKFQGSKEEIEAYEKRIKELKTQMEGLERTAQNASAAIKTQADKTGSETTLNTNLDTLRAHIKEVYEALSRMGAEYAKLEAAGIQDEATKKRIENLRQYHEWLKKVEQTADLSKSGALKGNDTLFNGVMIGGKEAKSWYNAAAQKEFSQMVEDLLKAKQQADATSEAFARMHQQMGQAAIGVGSSRTGGMRGGGTWELLESINRVGESNIQTLIKEQGRLERLIELAKKSIAFGEGHDVAGMQGLRTSQRQNLANLESLHAVVKNILAAVNQGDQAAIRFLNTVSALRTTPLGKDASGNDITLLGGHFDQLTHNVTGTAAAMRQLNRDMQLDNADAYKKWNTEQLTSGLDKVKNAIKDITELWDKAGIKGNTELEQKVAHQLNGLNEVRRNIEQALNNNDLLRTRHGASNVLGADYKGHLSSASRLQQTIREDMASYNDAGKKITDVTIKLEKYEQELGRVGNLKVDTSGLEAQRQKIKELLELLQQIKANGGLTDDKRSYSQVMQEFWQYIKLADHEAKKLRDTLKEVHKTFSGDPIADVKKSIHEEVTLLKQLQTALQQGKNAGLNVGQLDVYVGQLTNHIKLLEGILNGSGKDVGAAVGFSKRLQDAARTQLDLANGRIAAANATRQMSDEERRLSQLMGQTTDQMRGQSQVLSDLKMLATQYLSVWGAQSFVNSIIQTGGLLEQQRLSIGAILGDMDQATELFGKIKALAVKSPFGVVELDKMSKQLTAYGFQYEELYDWTKRLADISAATGTEVSRLSLALGHVRSEGALSGYTLRQFAMGNVPMLRMLAENRGVSTKEIRDLVRKKEISDKEVEEVLKQLTSDGGMFNNAQEVMSEALNAKFKNLHDAFDIMYGEIAESAVGDGLKRIAEVLTEGAKEWERYGADILYVVSAIGTYKAVMAVLPAIQAHSTNATIQQIVATTKQDRANLKLAQSYRQLTFSEQESLNSKTKLNATNVAVALSTKNLTQEELLRAVALGKLSKAEADTAIRAAQLNAEEKAGMLLRLQSVNVMTRSERALYRLKVAMRSLGATMKTFLPFAALGVLVDLIGRSVAQSSDAKDASETMSVKALENYKQAVELREQLDKKKPTGTEELAKAVDDMEQALTAAGRYDDALKQQAASVENLSDKYDLLHGRLVQTADDYQYLKSVTQAYMEEGLRNGGGAWYELFGVFRDTALENMKDVTRKSIGLHVAENNMSGQSGAVRTIIQAAMGSSWQDEYGSLDWKELFAKAKENGSKFWEAAATIPDDVLTKTQRENALKLIKAYSEALGEYNGAWNQLTDVQLGDFGDNMLAAFGVNYKRETGKDFSLKMEEGEGGFDYMVRLSKFTSYLWNAMQAVEAEGVSPEVIERMFAWLTRTKWIIPAFKEVQGKAVTDELEQWQREVQDFFDSHNIDIKVKADDSLESVREQLKKKKESLQKEVDQSKPILIGLGLKLDALPDNIDDFLKQQGIEKDSFKGRLARWAFNNFVKGQNGIKGIEDAEKENPGLVPADKDKNKNHEDKRLKEARTQLEEVKSFLQEYKKYEAVYGRELSLGILGELFPKVDGADVVDNYKAVLGRIKSSLPMTSEERKKFGISIDKLIADTNFDEAKKNIDKQLGELQEEIGRRSERFNLYKTLLGQTGDESFARQAFEDGRVWDELSKGFAEQLKTKLTLGGSGLDVESLWGLTDAEAKEQLKGVSGAYELWKKTVEIVRGNYVEGLKAAGDATAKMLTAEEKVANIEREIDELRKKGANNNDVRILAKQIELAKTQGEVLENSKEYLQFYTSVLSMTIDKAEAIGGKIKKNLVDQLSAGAISANEYMRGIRNVDQQLEKIRNKKSLAEALSTGGVKGWVNQQREQAESEESAKAIEVEDAQKRLNEAIRKGDEEHIKACMQALALAQTELATAKKQSEVWQKASQAVNKVQSNMYYQLVVGFARYLQTAKEETEKTGEYMDMDPWADDTSAAIGGIDNGLSAIMSGDLFGGLVKTIMGPINAVIQNHDARRDHDIEVAKQYISELEANTEVLKSLRERALGYDSFAIQDALRERYKNGEALSSYTGKYKSGEAVDAMKSFYRNQGLQDPYALELAELEKERQLYLRAYDDEYDKKNSSEEQLLEYQQKIAELDEQIMFFTEDLAKELWGIDLAGWADQLGDALVTAWENGEDAAKAFDDTVSDIMRDMVRKMVNLGAVEPLFQQLREKLFGEEGAVKWKLDGNGNKIGMDWEASQADTLAAMNAALGDDGYIRNALVNTIPEMMDDIQAALPNINLKSEDESSSVGSSVKGITEQTANLIASYLNAIRADVSVLRSFGNQLAQSDLPDIKRMMTAGNASLVGIDNNTRAIMRMMEQGSGAMYQRIVDINDRLNRFALGVDKVTMK